MDKSDPIWNVLKGRVDLTSIQRRQLETATHDPEMQPGKSLGHWNTHRSAKTASAITGYLIDTFGDHWLWFEDTEDAETIFALQDRDPRSAIAEQQYRNSRQKDDNNYNTGYEAESGDNDHVIDPLWFLDPITDGPREWTSEQTTPIEAGIAIPAGKLHPPTDFQEKTVQAYDTWLATKGEWKMPIPIPGMLPTHAQVNPDPLPRCSCGRFLDSDRCWVSKEHPTNCPLDHITTKKVSRMTGELV